MSAPARRVDRTHSRTAAIANQTAPPFPSVLTKGKKAHVTPFQSVSLIHWRMA